MTADRKSALPPWLPSWWPYYAFAVSIVAIVGLVLGVVGVYVNGRQDAADAAGNKARDTYNRKLLDCFDDFATDLSGGLPPVRTATAAANDALAAGIVQLKVGLAKVGLDEFTPADLQRIIRAFDKYETANDHLGEVRKQNPYPPPPSEFCTLP